MISRFNHHLLCGKKVAIKLAGHLSETFFNHHFLITMGPCLTLATHITTAAIHKCGEPRQVSSFGPPPAGGDTA